MKIEKSQKKRKALLHSRILRERAKHWDPFKNKHATKDGEKTIFIARLSYELTGVVWFYFLFFFSITKKKKKDKEIGIFRNFVF